MPSSANRALRPAYHSSLNLLPPFTFTGVPFTKSVTAAAGMTKLKPCTMLPSGPGASDTKVSRPTTLPRSSTTGPPELPHAAGASVWITVLLFRSCLNPEIAPLVIDASTIEDWFRSSCESTTPGKPMMCTGSPIWAPLASASESTG